MNKLGKWLIMDGRPHLLKTFPVFTSVSNDTV